mgnify:CR=1 FL=1
MAETPVKITLGFPPRVEVAGTDISNAISGLTLTADAGSLSVLTLTLPIIEAGELDGEARVFIPDETKDLLMSLGWTPPGIVDITPVGAKHREYLLTGEGV